MPVVEAILSPLPYTYPGTTLVLLLETLTTDGLAVGTLPRIRSGLEWCGGARAWRRELETFALLQYAMLQARPDWQNFESLAVGVWFDVGVLEASQRGRFFVNEITRFYAVDEVLRGRLGPDVSPAVSPLLFLLYSVQHVTHHSTTMHAPKAVRIQLRRFRLCAPWRSPCFAKYCPKSCSAGPRTAPGPSTSEPYALANRKSLCQSWHLSAEETSGHFPTAS